MGLLGASLPPDPTLDPLETFKQYPDFYIYTINKAELILENQQTWREENSDLKESLETMKKDMEHMEKA